MIMGGTGDVYTSAAQGNPALPVIASASKFHTPDGVAVRWLTGFEQ
jgi:hypothetical protein